MHLEHTALEQSCCIHNDHLNATLSLLLAFDP